jgi:hypothetical protein
VTDKDKKKPLIGPYSTTARRSAIPRQVPPFRKYVYVTTKPYSSYWVRFID